jgi:pimeloyl-ACP methyl ester carboxylesterase
MRWILLRGLTREAGHWGGLPAQLAERTGEPVTALDLPGNGSRHGERSLASVHATAQDCRRRTAAGEPVLLVAMSLGAMVALEWARIAPERVAGCVLINTSTGGASWPWQRLRPRNYGALLRMLLPGQSLLERERRVLAMTSACAQAQPGRAEHWARLAAAHPVAPANALRQLWAAARYRAPRRPLPVPLLLLACAGDALVSPRCSQALARRWEVPLRMHPWAGHDLPLDDPGWLVDTLCEWRHTLAR